MGGVIVTFGGIAVLCASGFVVSATLKWFHTYEANFQKIGGNKRKGFGGDDSDTNLNHIRKRAQSRN